ncbi:IS110 family RNA-guided transposase [Flexibacterium corallicola]|uniref:IS110 family transposase n=1 Tax=Flexibacterium corallicola TaxID=3037259 RepID=UPI00286F8A21|nr:IS110 family transposase [Pseudovibrio sp. M1P-2-3]
MTKIVTVGLDLAKSIFQVHCADEAGTPLLRKRMRRGQVIEFFAGIEPCLVGMEACSSAHYWARELQALGHEVKLVPPQDVKPFVKSQKNDAADAEAIAEAVQRPTMRFAAIKSAEQQSLLDLHRTRELLVRQKTMLINAIRGHCGEFGLVVGAGAAKVSELIIVIKDSKDTRLPALARKALNFLAEQLKETQTQIKALERKLNEWHTDNEDSKRLETIPGVGVITATALVATIGDVTQFRSARQLAAWLGLVPKQYSNGGKEKLGRISKRGDGYLRKLLVHGARTSLGWSRRKQDGLSQWQKALLERRPTNVVLVAMANKMARTVWALLSKSQTYRYNSVEV